MADKFGLGTEVRELKIGQSFFDKPTTSSRKKGPTYHTIRYDFKPASVNASSDGFLQVDESNNGVSITVPHKGGGETNFSGHQKEANPKECVLVIDRVTGEITLEKLSSQILVKKTRQEKKFSGGNEEPNRVMTPTRSLSPSSDVLKSKFSQKRTGGYGDRNSPNSFNVAPYSMNSDSPVGSDNEGFEGGVNSGAAAATTTVKLPSADLSSSSSDSSSSDSDSDDNTKTGSNSISNIPRSASLMPKQRASPGQESHQQQVLPSKTSSAASMPNFLGNDDEFDDDDDDRRSNEDDMISQQQFSLSSFQQPQVSSSSSSSSSSSKSEKQTNSTSIPCQQQQQHSLSMPLFLNEDLELSESDSD